MYALDNNSGVSAMPAVKNQQFQPNAPRWFTEGGNGVAPSYPGADWFNIVQAELLNILSDGKITPVKGQFNQITLAIKAIVNQAANAKWTAVDASLSQKGIVQLSSSTTDSSENKAATPKAVKAVQDAVNNLQSAVNTKSPSASPTFSGTVRAPTPAQTVNDTTVATTAYVRAAIAALVGSAPATLDTLAEIAQALAGDANVKATLLAEIGKKANATHNHSMAQIDGLNGALNGKAPLNSPTFSGTVRAPTPAQTVSDTTVATTAYVRAAIAALVGSAPATLDTLAEIAQALAGDANVKATLLAEIGKKANANHTHTVGQITNFTGEVNKLIHSGVSYRTVGESTIFKLNDGTMIQTGQIKGLFDERNVSVVFPEAFHLLPATIQLTEIQASTSMGHATQLVALDWKNTGFTAWRNSTQDNRESKACYFALGRWK